MLVDIVVRGLNEHERVQRCVDSINENTEIDKYRIILVDDGSEPPLDIEGADVSIRTEESFGLSTTTNLGISSSLARLDTEYTLILDGDTHIPNGDISWLDRFIYELEEGGPSCGCVGATSDYSNPPQQILAAPLTYLADWEGGSKTNPDAIWFMGFAVLFRKTALRHVGMFDERYNPANYEDTDYAVALRAAGYSIRVACSVYIHHDKYEKMPEAVTKMLIHKNGQKFYRKWGAGRLFDMGVVAPETMKSFLDTHAGAVDDGN